MAKRLNPKRRAEMRERREAILRNPTLMTETGRVRSNSGQWNAPRGSSLGLARGILHQEANLPTFQKPKRRKATKMAVHVNPGDLKEILTPEKVENRLGAQRPLPRKTAKKLWSNS